MIIIIYFTNLMMHFSINAFEYWSIMNLSRTFYTVTNSNILPAISTGLIVELASIEIDDFRPDMFHHYNGAVCTVKMMADSSRSVDRYRFTPYKYFMSVVKMFLVAWPRSCTGGSINRLFDDSALDKVGIHFQIIGVCNTKGFRILIIRINLLSCCVSNV